MWMDEFLRVYNDRKGDTDITSVLVVSWKQVDGEDRAFVDVIPGPNAQYDMDSIIVAAQALQTLSYIVDNNEKWKKHPNANRVKKAMKEFSHIIAAVGVPFKVKFHKGEES